MFLDFTQEYIQYGLPDVSKETHLLPKNNETCHGEKSLSTELRPIVFDYFSLGSRSPTSGKKSPNYVTYAKNNGRDSLSLSSSNGLNSEDQSSFCSPSVGLGMFYDENSELNGLNNIDYSIQTHPYNEGNYLQWKDFQQPSFENNNLQLPHDLFASQSSGPSSDGIDVSPIPNTMMFPTNMNWNYNMWNENYNFQAERCHEHNLHGDECDKEDNIPIKRQKPSVSRSRKQSYEVQGISIAQKVDESIAKHNGWFTYGEALTCGHCDETFLSPQEYALHLDSIKIHHESVCPEESCIFNALGFKFRWALRRHICNHHLRQYNDSSDSNKQASEETQQFLKHVYVCSVNDCSRAFYRLDSLLRHQRLIHGFHHTGAKRKRSELSD